MSLKAELLCSSSPAQQQSNRHLEIFDRNWLGVFLLSYFTHTYLFTNQALALVYKENDKHNRYHVLDLLGRGLLSRRRRGEGRGNPSLVIIRMVVQLSSDGYLYRSLELQRYINFGSDRTIHNYAMIFGINK